MSRRLCIAALIATSIGAAIVAPSASAAGSGEVPTIVHLRVSGGEATWHPVDDFRLDWDRIAGDPPVSAVHYLVRGEAGEVVVPEAEIAEDVDEIEHVRVLSGPGAYRVEVWLEGLGGEYGAPATASLRFDDVAPGRARPIAPSGWVAADAPAILRIEHPRSPVPVSGIRGYAVSVDRGAERAPCESATRCTLAETDLSGGIGKDTISLYGLPEGTSFARVVAVSRSGMRSAKVESAIVRVDATRPEVELHVAPRGWSDGPVRLTATASDALSGMAASGPAGPYTAIAIDGRAPTVAAGDSASAMVSGEGAHGVAFYARDAAGNVADGEAGAPPPAHTVVRIDETPPEVAFARAQDPAEPERIEAAVTDALSGPSQGRGTIAVRPAGSSQPFMRLPTTVSGEGLVADWDSDSYPVGAYEFRATGYDAAGNSSAGDRRLGGARMVLRNPLKEPTAVESGFGPDFGRRPPTRTVSYGHGTAFGGRLTSAAGAALGDLPVAVTETFAPGARPARRTTVVRTRPDGSFLVHLAPGPSRDVEASFAGDRLLTRSSGPSSRFDVRASIRLHASVATAKVGGAPVVFSGQVGQLGASIPTDGLPVQLQFRLPDAGWSEFRTVQTDARGRFRYPYTFSDDDSRGIRFQFRAYLGNQEGWPYEPAASRPVLIAGR